MEKNVYLSQRVDTLRKIILIGLVLSLVFPMGAQMSYSVRAGLSYSSLVQRIDGVSESGSRMGYSVAGGAMYQYHRHWGVHSELAFVNQGGSYYSAKGESDSKAVFNRYNYYSRQRPVQLT